jgi:uncharacterized OsmC-like protein
MAPQIRNGVNVDNLVSTIEAIRGTPSIAEFTFRADNEWLDGGHNRTTIEAFYGAGQEDTSRAQPFVIDADEPPVLLGENRGANPVELLLNALAACLTTSLVYHGAACGIELESVRAHLEGDLNLHGFLGMSDNIRNGYQAIRVTFTVKGDATRDQLEELVRVAQARSPVFDIVSNPVPVIVELSN